MRHAEVESPRATGPAPQPAGSRTWPGPARTGRRRTGRRRTGRRWRAALVGVATVATVGLVPLSVLTVWAHHEVTDTDRYLALVGPVLGDPAVQRALTEQVSDALADQLPLEELPDPVASGITRVLADQVAEAVGSDAFARAWVAAHRVGHEHLLAVLDGSDDSTLVLRGDAVQIDGAGVLRDVEDALSALGMDVDLPDVEVRVPLLEDAAVGDVREGYQALGTAARWLPVLVALAAAVAVVAARDRRRHLLVLAAGTAAVLAVVCGGAAAAGQSLIDEVAGGGGLTAAVESAVLDRAVASLLQAAGTSAALASAVAALAWAGGHLGRRQPRSRGRRR